MVIFSMILSKESNQGGETGWKKGLYEPQIYPDNYIPPTFLQDLRKNVNLQYYTLKEAIIHSGALTQEINCIIIFIQVFNLLQSDDKSSSYTCVYIGIITLLLYTTLILSSKSDDVIGELKTGIILIFSGFAVSPILKTLTETISTDTIYAMVTLMMIIHLIFFDYGVKVAIVSPSLSLNSAIFAGVCLASRLASSYQAFALLTFATDIFVLFTICRSKLRDIIPVWVNYFITCLLTFISLILLLKLSSPIFSIIYIILLIFVNLILPYNFWSLQSYKENIYGPWDEAVIKKDDLDN
ncbi:phosphatidylinositol N-acetylglucosaminyltransferase subunit C isoform X2 [Tetranychus urticae]|uniref:Phosphatidylinositol N-acetylglucosaminyltransferase n=1 Tax=Tetranychus urticae TaxID=32264 RepID=T1K650_TETUR|nr:phosphatidylinositol N-acetylglucosaminyltransferase subunit C isoform X2 [Tetranychus urticae]